MSTNEMTDTYLAIDMQDGIHLRRTVRPDEVGGVSTNVPHIVVHHSPSGFEWGYGGSGPADLALNIAEAILTRIGWMGERMPCYNGTCFRLAYSLHQDLKWQFISSVPRKGTVIPYETIKSWIEARIPTN